LAASQLYLFVNTLKKEIIKAKQIERPTTTTNKTTTTTRRTITAARIRTRNV
jgi:hypothetical protein